MIAVDSSILVRYIAQDDKIQSPLATRLLENELSTAQPGLITVVAVLEMTWVLRRIYRQDQESIRSIIRRLLDAPNLIVEHAAAMEQALSGETGLADGLLHYIGRELGSEKTVTFDRKFARLEGVALLA